MVKYTENSVGAVNIRSETKYRGKPIDTLMIGMGNPILADDSIGVRLAQTISRRLGPVPGLSVMEECSVGGLNILEVAAGYQRWIIFDSVKTSAAPPGYWFRFNADSLKETMNLTNIHDINLASALVLGRRLGLVLPGNSEIHIFAVEVLDNITFSEQMSPPLEEAFPHVAEEIFQEVAQLLGIDIDQGTRNENK